MQTKKTTAVIKKTLIFFITVIIVIGSLCVFSHANAWETSEYTCYTNDEINAKMTKDGNSDKKKFSYGGSDAWISTDTTTSRYYYVDLYNRIKISGKGFGLENVVAYGTKYGWCIPAAEENNWGEDATAYGTIQNASVMDAMGTASIGDLMRLWLAPAAASNYAGLVKEAGESVDNSRSLLETSIRGNESSDSSAERIQAQIFKFAQTICNDVVLPVAFIMIAFILAMQIYEAVCERNNMNDMGSGFFIQLIIKMAILILVVANAWTLTGWIFDLGAEIVKMAGNASAGTEIATNSGDVNLNDYTFSQLAFYFYFSSVMDLQLGFGDILLEIIQSWLLDIVMRVLNIIIWVVVEMRLLQIMFMMALAPIPLATFGNREWGMTGRNYLKSLFALALQALLIFMCLLIYQVMISSIFSGNASMNQMVAQIWTMLGFSIVLIFIVLKTGSISKSILDAH